MSLKKLMFSKLKIQTFIFIKTKIKNKTLISNEEENCKILAHNNNHRNVQTLICLLEKNNTWQKKKTFAKNKLQPRQKI
jgi:hypothetical protein